MNQSYDNWDYGLYTLTEDSCQAIPTMYKCQVMPGLSYCRNLQVICDCPDTLNCNLMVIRKEKLERNGTQFQICDMQQNNWILSQL